MNLEDPLTADYPSRTPREEEEEQAQAGTQHYADPPVVLWTPAARAAFQDGQLRPRLMVVAVGPAPCILLHLGCNLTKVAGSVVVGDLPLAGNTLLPSLADHSCFMYLTDGGDTLVVACQADVPAERAVAWTRGLSTQVQAERVIILGTLMAHAYQGPADPTQAELQYVIETSRAKGQLAHGVPYLPPGTLASGLAAAILSHCQARQVPAVLLLGVQVWDAPDAAFLLAFGKAFGSLADAVGLPLSKKRVGDRRDLAAACASLKGRAMVTMTSSVYA